MSDPFDALLVTFYPPGRGEAVTFPCPSDLRFDSELPGGFKSLSCTLSFPEAAPAPAGLQVLSRVRVVDGRHGGTVWYGKLTDPGLTVAVSGAQTYSITAEGCQQDLDGWREVYGLVDRAQESWQAVGEFQGSSVSTGGDLSPDGDYTGVDLGDLGDLGDELGTDFGGDLGDGFDGDLGGGLPFDPGLIDLGEFPGGIDLGGLDPGAIDLGGADFPEPANYEGYLGHINDPFSDEPGVQTPIDLGDGFDPGAWPGWVPGLTTPGGTAFGSVPSSGTLRFARTYDGAPGSVARRRTADRGLMQQEDFYAPGSPFWSPGIIWSDPDNPPPLQWVHRLSFSFRIMAAGAVARLWLWATEDLATSGYYCDISTTAVSLYKVDAGAASLLTSKPVTLTVGVTYDFGVIPTYGVGNGPGDYVGYDPAKGMVDGLCLAGGQGVMSAGLAEGVTQLALVQYIPESDSSFHLIHPADAEFPVEYDFGPVTWVNRLTGGVQHYMLQDGRYWGLAMVGDGTTTPQDVEFDDIQLNGSAE